MAYTVSPAGPFTATAGTTTLSMPEARYPGQAAGITVTCNSSVISGSFLNGVPVSSATASYSGCKATSPFTSASVSTVEAGHLYLANSKVEVKGIRLSVIVGGCSMQFFGSEVAPYPVTSTVTSFTFANLGAGSYMSMTKVPTGIACEATFGSKQAMKYNASYTFDHTMTINP